MSVQSFLLGNEVRLYADFKTIDGVYADPTVVTLKIKKPDDSIVTLTHPGDVVKTATGKYYYDFLTAQVSMHYYRYEGDPTLVAAAESQFNVTKSTLEDCC